MNSIDMLLVVLGIGAVLFLTYRSNLARSAALLLGVFLFISFNNLPALATPHLAALGSTDAVLTQEQEQLEEEMKTTPEGAQYSGLEYVKENLGTSVSDKKISDRIDKIKGDLVANVTNGSVILSGTVKDKKTARSIVEKVKEIPGVHEITFELALENLASGMK